MKILGICSGALYSGKEGVTVNIARGWKNKHEVKIFFSGWHDGIFQKHLNDLGIENYPLKLGWYYVSKWLWSLDSLLHYPRALRQYLKAQKKLKPDVIYVDSYRPVVLLRPFLKGKIVLHVHDPHAQSKTDRIFLKRIQNRVDRFIAVSHFIKADLIAAGVSPEKIVVVHNGIDVPERSSKTYLPDGKIRIGIVGQVIPRKGHEDLIEACCLLKEQGVPFDLFIYGNGEKTFVEELKHKISERGLSANIHWGGFEKSKSIIYNNLDVVVAPTRNEEPFALVALESSAHKVPVIASRSGGFPESIIDCKTGYIIAKNSPGAIAEKIKALVKNPSLLEQLGEEAYCNMLCNFTSGKMRNEIENVLFSLYE